MSLAAMRAMCNPVTGVCSGSVGGFSVDGWTFAADDDVHDLYRHFGLPEMTHTSGTSYSYFSPDGFYGTKVDDFLDTDGIGPDTGLFDVTFNTFSEKSIAGYTRTINASGPNPNAAIATVGMLELNSTYSLVALSATNNGLGGAGYGFWMYRTAEDPVATQLPLPGTLPLASLAIAVAAVVVRRRGVAAQRLAQ